MNWYGVRVLYCAHITGEPSGPMPDPHYHGDDFYEESLCERCRLKLLHLLHHLIPK